MLAIIALFATAPVVAYIASGYEARRMEREHAAALDAVKLEGAKEFKRMYDAWTASSTAA